MDFDATTVDDEDVLEVFFFYRWRLNGRRCFSANLKKINDKLENAKVVIFGAGGLGNSVALMLATSRRRQADNLRLRHRGAVES